LEILADGCVRLAEAVGFIQYFLIEGVDVAIWQEDRGLIDPTDGSQE